MNKFNERLNQLVKESHLSKKDFAERIGVPCSTFHTYLIDREPNYDTLIKIAIKCHTTPNWLVGFSEERDGSDATEAEIKNYREMLIRISEIANVSQPFVLK